MIDIAASKTQEGALESRTRMALEHFLEVMPTTERQADLLDQVCSPGRQAHPKDAELDPLKGGRDPIRLGGRHRFRAKCKPMDAEWKAGLASDTTKAWYSGNPGFRKPYKMSNGTTSMDVWRLRDGLVDMGGAEVCLPTFEPDLQEIISRGQLWGDRSLTTADGLPNRCHENCAALWNLQQGTLFLATGYALSDDGLWRQHSWCIQPRVNGALLVETTKPRLLYFGFVIGLRESLRFALSQAGTARLCNGTAPRYGQREVVLGDPIWFE